MLTKEAIERIRRDHFEKGVPLRQIARSMKLSRNTVRKAVRSGDTAFRYARRTQLRPKLGPWTTELDCLLEANQQKHCQDRLPLTRLHEDLTELGYDGGYDAVRRYAMDWRHRRYSDLPKKAAIPLRFDPGEAYRFDWSQEDVVLAGVATRAHVAHIRLCHSHMFLVRAYPSATEEMWCDAHTQAFRFFGGTCRTGIYNHMKPILRRMVAVSTGRFKPRFLEMCEHYGIKPAACMPGEDWEKGTTERQLRHSRKDLFVPRPEAGSLPDLNAWLAERCAELARSRPHPAFEGKSIRDVFEVEQPRLAAVEPGFDGSRKLPAEASATCLVKFDHNQYSVNASAAGRSVTVRAFAERIVIRAENEVVAEHPRCFRRGEILYDPWHYVPALRSKPCALRNGAPFRNWELPGALGRMYDMLTGIPDGDRQFVSILSEVPRQGLERVEDACAQALDLGICSAAGVKRFLPRVG